MTSDELDRMELLWQRRLPIKVIADRLGYSIPRIRQVVSGHRDRFPARRHDISVDEKQRQIKRILNGEVSKQDVSTELNVRLSTVERWMREGRRT